MGVKNMKTDIKHVLHRLEKKEISKEQAMLQVNAIKNQEECWSFKYNESYLKDHTVFGEQVLLGVTHCALALNVAHRLKGSYPVQIKKMLFENPIFVSPNDYIDIRTEVEKKGADIKSFISFYKKSNDVDWSRAASAEILDSLNHSQPFPVDFKSLMKNGKNEMTGKDVYGNLSDSSVVHGTTLQTVKKVSVGEEFVISTLKLAEEYKDSSYLIHPSLMDGSIVSSMCGIERPKGTFIPLMVKKITSYGCVPETCYSVSKVIKKNTEIIEVNIWICDESGACLLFLEGLTCKKVDPTVVGIQNHDKENETKRVNEEKSHVDREQYTKPQVSLETKAKQYLLGLIERLLPKGQRLSDEHKNFMDIGIDSTQLISLAQDIEHDLSIELYPTLFFEYQNVKDLLNYFLENHAEALKKKLNVQETKQDTKIKVKIDEIVKNEEESAANGNFEFVSSNDSTQQVEIDEHDIAVIGMSGVFADSPDVHTFWDNIRQQKDLIREIPKDHFDYEPWYDAKPYAPDKMYCKWGSFIDEVDKFDAEFFNISPREAEMMDPQMRLLMQVIYSTLEDAGYSGKIAGTNTGMYVGACFQDYKDHLPKRVDPHSGTGNASTMLANRPSFYFNLLGPSLFVDTACSSSLVALHLACTAIRNKECSMAFVAGTNLLLSSHHYRYFCSIGALSQTGRCHTFDNAADGYVPGEGVGAVLVKPLRQALEDGDRIHAVIKGSAINHGGYTPSITAPSMKQEAKVILDAWKDSRIDPQTLGYIEAHGTGTKLGDPVEINALKEAFKSYSITGEPFCAIGSAKAHIGHAEGAAGIAGLIKVILSLKNKEIPAMPNFKEINSYIKLEGSPLYINNEVIPWESSNEESRRAGVSSFGFGGAYAHIVVEEYIQSPEENVFEEDEGPSASIILLSALNNERLHEKAKQLRSYIMQKKGNLRLEEIAYTLQVGRQHMGERVAFIAEDIDSLIKKLTDFMDGYGLEEGIYKGNVRENEKTLKLILSGVSGTDFMHSIYKNQELDKLAQLWVWGSEGDWKSTQSTNKLIYLPSYPFAKKRFWASPSKPEALIEKKTSVLGHLNSRRSLSEAALVYDIPISSNHQMMNEHQVYGNPTLPAAAILDIAVEAASLLENEQSIALEDVVFLKPLVVKEQEKIMFSLKREISGHEFELQIDNQTETQSYARGKIKLGERLLACPPIGITQFIREAESEIHRETIYSTFDKLGVKYGAFFKSIKQVWMKGSQALCLIDIQGGDFQSPTPHQIHPSILDGALQSILAIRMEIGSEGLGLPFNIERLEKHGPLGLKVYAYVEAHSENRYDIIIMNESGQIGVVIRGFYLRPINKSSSSFFYVPKWKLTSQSLNSSTSMRKTVHIVAPSDVGVMVQAIKKKHQMDDVSVRDYGKSLDQNQDSHSEKPDLIYFLGGFVSDPEEYSTLELTKLHEIHERGVISFQRLLQELLAKGYRDQKIEIKIITNQAFSLDHCIVSPFAGGVLGYAKAVVREIPQWTMQCIDISTGHSKNAEHLWTKAAEQATMKFCGNQELMIRESGCYTRALYAAEFEKSEKSQFKMGGTYMIVGGKGGIGLELAKYLIGNYKAKIILTGRSALSNSMQEEIKELSTSRNEVLYIQADLTDVKQMQSAKEVAKQHFGWINGVIHSAVILEDQSLENMKQETLLSVIRPKAEGSLILYEVFKNEELDFMLFFSSIQSLSGNSGQSNYAAACSYKDALANWIGERVSYPVRTINWGYWGSVGVVASENYQKQLAAKGLFSIQPAEGMDAIERILTSNIRQVIAIKADAKVMSALGDEAGKKMKVAPLDSNYSDLERIAERSTWPEQGGEQQQLSKDFFEKIEKFGQELLLNVLSDMGAFLPETLSISKKELFKRLNITPFYSKLFDGLLNILRSADYLENIDDEIMLKSNLKVRTREELLQQKKEWMISYPDIVPQLELLWQCISHYPAVLTGKLKATDVLFPNSSMELVEGIYKGNANTDYYHSLMTEATKKYIENRLTKNPKHKIKLLEIGAGTGGTTSWILKGIEKYQEHIDYTYTDISQAFLKYGEQKFSPHYPFLNFKKLNIEEDISKQGFAYASYDVVLAANVLHATKNISETIERVKSLISPHGWLLINEATQRMDFLTMTFGLLEGWWQSEDRNIRIPHSPLLSESSWADLLKREGFTNAVLPDRKHSLASTQHVVIAESNGCYNINSKEKQQEKSNLIPIKRIESVIDKPVETRKIQKQNTKKSLNETEIQDRVKMILSQALQVEIEALTSDKQFSEMGVDSIIGLELISAINEHFGIILKTTVLFDYSNVRELSLYIKNNFELEAITIKQDSSFEQKEGLSADVLTFRKENHNVERPLSEKELLGFVEEHLKQFLQSTLRMTEQEMDLKKPFTDYGLDSILGLELIQSLNESLDISLRTTSLFDYGNIYDLSR
ncbi:SDR family NAD(P)-dependent oxidoreductase, partial [Saccharibacillus sacchari]